MITSCIALFAVLAQINAGCIPQTCLSAVPTCSLLSGASSSNLVSSFDLGVETAGTGAVARTVVAKGKYPVALANCGSNGDTRVPITTSQVTAPCQEKLVRLPCSIPQPKVISHCCTCYKTVVKPRVHQQIITVPSVQRYIQTAQKPVFENIEYEAVPINCAKSSSKVQIVSLSSGVGACAPVVPALSSCSSVEIPKVPVFDASCASAPVVPVVAPSPSVEIPKLPVFDVSCVPASIIPSVAPYASHEIPKLPVFDVSCASAPVVPAEASCASVEIPKLPVFDVSCVSSPVVPTVSCSSSVEIPKLSVFEVPKCPSISLACGQC